MIKHAYLPRTLIPLKGSAFVSQVTKEVAGVLVITLKHVTTSTHKTLACLNVLTRQSNVEDRNRRVEVIVAKVRLVLFTTHHTTQVLAVNRVEYFKIASPIMPSI